ncbi:MAG TPA: GNAT family N-acetyltransferase [Candidatus Limnocylindrales bacterium]|nr:GNAT family N-acetyltransferase [Candidatus Limnocylindrales bacterium]
MTTLARAGIRPDRPASEATVAIDLRGVELPDGVRLRRWRGLDADLPAMWAVADAARVADGEVERTTYDGLATYYRHLERSDLDRDLVIAELHGEFAGFARVEWHDSNDGERWYEGVGIIDPALRRRRIGAALLAWTERRRVEIARAQAAADPALHERSRWLTTFLFDGNVGGKVLLTAAGYEPFRRFATMRRADLEAIESHELPAGLEIRPIRRDLAEMRRVFDADAEAFRDHFGWVEATDESFAEFVEDPDVDPEGWIVAFDGDEIAGGVLNGIHQVPGGAREGWLDSVFVRRPWRRRGLARALIARSLWLLRERGMSTASLGVDLSNVNQALALYESCGFRAVSSATAYRKPLPSTGDGPREEAPR